MDRPVPSDGLPFNGVRALCITTVWAGTFAAQLLADWGCEVIRIESIRNWQAHTRGRMVRPTKQMVLAHGVPWIVGYPRITNL